MGGGRGAEGSRPQHGGKVGRMGAGMSRPQHGSRVGRVGAGMSRPQTFNDWILLQTPPIPDSQLDLGPQSCVMVTYGNLKVHTSATVCPGCHEQPISFSNFTSRIPLTLPTWLSFLSRNIYYDE